jgi:HK97 family phage prohead protease
MGLRDILGLTPPKPATEPLAVTLAAPDRAPDILFNFAGDIRAFTKKDASGKELLYLGGTASSTAEDLYGDILDGNAQESMKNQFAGLTAWLNHSYKIPEDTLGVFERASLQLRADASGQQFVDLDIECRIYDDNPRALAAYNQVKEGGIRHGWSIAGYFTDLDWKDKDSWSFIVHDVKLLEASLVGIPANQRSWAKTAKSVDASIKRRAVAAAERIARTARELVMKSLFETRDDGGEMSPDDMRDKVTLALAHLANAKEHGLCVKGIDHVQQATTHLSAILDTNDDGGTVVSPEGDENPIDNYHADPIVIKISADTTAAQAELKKLADLVEQNQASFDKLTGAIVKATEQSAALDAEIAEKTKRKEALDVELKTLQDAIAAAKAEPLGRRSAAASARIAANETDSVAPPEAYKLSAHEQARALGEALLAGKSGPPAGRDTVSGR